MNLFIFLIFSISTNLKALEVEQAESEQDCNLQVRSFSNGELALFMSPRCSETALLISLKDKFAQNLFGNRFYLIYQMVDFNSFGQAERFDVNQNVISFIYEQQSKGLIQEGFEVSNTQFKESFLHKIQSFSWYKLISSFLLANGCDIPLGQKDSILDGKMHLMDKETIAKNYNLELNTLTKSHYSVGFEYTASVVCRSQNIEN
ncbi:hypothetical protein [Pseudoalteromonas luteoviolacea]|uniref:hypothetical protein n=1 Tax=Pseudoalteromonas luteoviolacea TaxID=43657 RepID=UPI001147102E|nr:hypothetical protein [Pseudoalteromonas luteoviolacea]